MRNRPGPFGDLRVLLVILLFLFLVLLVITSKVIIGWDFRNNLWGPAHLLTQGNSPYKIETLFDLGNAVWLPMTIGLFFPLGFIPLQQASNIWFLINLVCLALIVWISSGFVRPPLFLLALCMTLSILFPPSITHFWLGQITIITTLIFLLVTCWEDKIPLFLSAFLIAIALSKPHLAILVLPGLMVYEAKSYGYKRVLQFAASIIVSALILTIPLFLAFPGWISDFIRQLEKNPSWAQPSSLNILRLLAPEHGEIIWLFLAILIFGINIWLWITKPRQEAILWSLALTPLITPYIWTWDFVMLLPLLVHFIFQIRSKVSLSILLGGYIAVWLKIADMKYHGQVREEDYWWIPWCILVIILVGANIRKNDSTVSHRHSFD